MQNMVGSDDQLLFTINKDLQPSKMNNNILSQQLPTNGVGIAWPTMHATVYTNKFYSNSRWMKEKGRHLYIKWMLLKYSIQTNREFCD